MSVFDINYLNKNTTKMHVFSVKKHILLMLKIYG